MSGIEIYESHCSADIDEFVRSADSPLIYQDSAYINLVAKVTSSNPIWIVCKNKGAVRGVLPVMVKDGEIGPIVNSMPFYGGNGGIISGSEDYSIRTQMLFEYEEFCKSIGAAASTLITNPIENCDGFYFNHMKYDFIDRRIGQMTFLPNQTNSVDLIKCFESVRRRNINKAQRNGVVVERNNGVDAWNFLAETHQQNMEVIGGKAKDKSFFLSVPECLEQKYWDLYIARIGDERVAALLLFYFNNVVEYYTPVVVERFRTFQPLSLLIFEAMVDAIKDGFNVWNWGGTWLDQSGVYNFKKKWGAVDKKYTYFNRTYKAADLYQFGIERLTDEYSNFYVVPFKEFEQLK